MADQVQINIGANAAGALAAFRSVGLAAKAMNATLAGVGIMAAAKAVQVATALPRTILKAIDDADAALRASQVAGMSVEDFSALSYAAGQAEISIADLEVASRYLAKTHNAALIPSLLVTADEFATMDDEVEKIRIATERFGKSGSNLIPFLNQGRKEIRRLIDEAGRIGVVFGKDFAVSADAFNDSWSKLMSQLKGFAVSLSQVVLPVLQGIVNALNSIGSAARSVGDSIKRSFDYFAAIPPSLKKFFFDEDPNEAFLNRLFTEGWGKALSKRLDFASKPMQKVLLDAMKYGASSDMPQGSSPVDSIAFASSQKKRQFDMPESTASSAWTSRGFLNFGEVQLANRTLSYQKTVTAYLSELVNLQKQYLPDVANALS